MSMTSAHILKEGSGNTYTFPPLSLMWGFKRSNINEGKEIFFPCLQSFCLLKKLKVSAVILPVTIISHL
jgi:hypothetical protein